MRDHPTRPRRVAGGATRRLTSLRQRELDGLYRELGAPGALPVGDTAGTALPFPGRAAGRVAGRLVRLLAWQGKVFDPERGTLLNKVTPLGLRTVRGRVCVAGSRLDPGRGAIVIDYRGSPVAWFVRDEIREVEPGLWLGMAFVGRWRVLSFLLRAPDAPVTPTGGLG